MLLKDWRTDRKWSLARLAGELGLDKKSPAETVRRWEEGLSRPDADWVAKISELTKGAVTAQDMHVVRLSQLEADASKEAAA